MSMTASAQFRARLRAREALLGVFVKTPHPSVVEALAAGGVDCVCLDAEHGPFDRRDLDMSLMAAHLHNIPAIVRVPSGAAHEILTALDLGAAGVLVPHVRSVDQAKAVAASCAYGPGGRGYAGGTRGNMGAGIAERMAQAAEETSVILQIEDIEAVPEADAIAALPGIDALFIGRVDLTVGLGETDPKAPRVMETVSDLTRRIGAAGRAVGMFCPDVTEVPDWQAKGASLFLLGSDHGFITAGARQLRKEAGL
jgi:2-keto-3-deoxy-L-rhamnonate aldolase RhmA